MMIPCKKCSKLFKPHRKDAKFCSFKCRTRWHANKRYLKVKDNPEYKEYAKKKAKEWIQNNYDRYLNLVREPNRIRSYNLFIKRRNKGICIYCGKKKAADETLACKDCRVRKSKLRLLHQEVITQ